MTTFNMLKRAVIAVVGVLAITGCRDLSASLPAGTRAPEFVHTERGALALHRGTLMTVRSALAEAIGYSGLFTDELSVLAALGDPNLAGRTPRTLDARNPDPNIRDIEILFGRLNAVRISAMQAIPMLEQHVPSIPSLRGELYALQGYAEILLTELFCSGVPLSTVGIDEGFYYAPGSTREEVLEHAVTLFDSALALSNDSVRLMHLALIGKARALVNLDRVAEAAQIVSDVSTEYKYELLIDPFISSSRVTTSNVSDREGGNGLPFVSSGDPRSWVDSMGVNNFGVPGYRAWKYRDQDLDTPIDIILASGVEARLIEAEADLRAGGDQWLTILNTLRTDGTVVRTYTRLDSTGRRAPNGTIIREGSPGPRGYVDTTWGPGTGIGLIPPSIFTDTLPVCPTSTSSAGAVCHDTIWYKGLAPLSDPGTYQARVDLLFRERAFWLFLTAHRLGDLRRLVRQYDREPESVYPSGLYGGYGFYGFAVVLPTPMLEVDINPNYSGCADTGA